MSLKTEYRNSMTALILEIQSQMRKNNYKKLEGNDLRVDVVIYRPRMYTYDLDNNTKILCDSLTKGGAIKDDRYITEIFIKKVESPKEFSIVRVLDSSENIKNIVGNQKNDTKA